MDSPVLEHVPSPVPLKAAVAIYDALFGQGKHKRQAETYHSQWPLFQYPPACTQHRMGVEQWWGAG
jgi:hypothetical protein